MASLPRVPYRQSALLLAVPEILVPFTPAQPQNATQLVYALGDAAGLLLTRAVFLEPSTGEAKATPTAALGDSDLLNDALFVGLDTRSLGYLYNGATGNPNAALDRMRSASAVNQALALKIGNPAVALVGNWSTQHDPAAAAQATITRAAGAAGVRHIATSIHASLSGGAAASGVMKVYLRDGAAGVGAILWSGNLQVAALGHAHIDLSALSIVGSAATAMTLEFAAAAGAGSQENVSLTGYDVA
jgi:hypothetical protein